MEYRGHAPGASRSVPPEFRRSRAPGGARCSVSCCRHPGECPVQNIHGKVGILDRDAHRRLDSKHVPVESSLPHQHAHLPSGFEHVERLRRRWLPRGSVGHELHAQHQAKPAHLSDEPVLRLQPSQSLNQAGANTTCVLLEAILVYHLEYRKTRGHRDWITTEGVEVNATGE